MDVSTVTQTTFSGATPVREQQRDVLASDFETFLRMLTAQARNQDPLEPLDSSEYAAQLAQFSMVEQQVRTNDMLAALVARLGATDMTELTGWIGIETRSMAPAWFDGSPVTVSPDPLADSDSAFLVVRDSGGNVIDRLAIDVSAEPVQWAGLSGPGQYHPPGLYSFSVESYRNGTLLLDDPAASYSRVAEARIENGEVVLVLDGGQAIPASTVTAVRDGT